MANMGYIRASSVDQNTARQLDGIAIDQTLIDKVSGKNPDRPQLHCLLEKVSAGDVVYVHSMYRLARNLQDLLTLVETFNKRGETVKFTKESIEFSPDKEKNPMSVPLLHLLGVVVQFERSLILERQKEGIAKAKERGTFKGRKTIDSEILKSAKVLVENGCLWDKQLNSWRSSKVLCKSTQRKSRQVMSGRFRWTEEK
ncbi:MAG: recombinase family protein [Burkholderiales bacterium]|nr:recombinase family protein [Burkholderiales bacterium]